MRTTIMSMALDDESNMFRNKFLVAMPSLQDNVFTQSVVYVAEHNTIGGAIGVIINKNLPTAAQQLISGLNFAEYNEQWARIPFYFGGPVELKNGFILHVSTEHQSEFTLTGDRQKIHLLAENNVQPLLFTAGYCFWDSLQLEYEVRMNHWLVIDSELSHTLLHVAPQERYSAAMKLAGISNLAFFDFASSGFNDI
jgi:putative transcriptional regulator